MKTSAAAKTTHISRFCYSVSIADPVAELGRVIVTGTRRAERTVAESLALIDLLGEQDLEASGKQSVRDLLGTLVPSINVTNNGAGASWAVTSCWCWSTANVGTIVRFCSSTAPNTPSYMHD